LIYKGRLDPIEGTGRKKDETDQIIRVLTKSSSPVSIIFFFLSNEEETSPLMSLG
jgi:hypothetical protein